VIGVVYLALAAFGIVANVVGDPGDPLHMTWWNVGLYGVTALVCAYVYSLRLRAT
jgi:hypothetical protein